jgi:hypothetical protein
MIAPVPYKQKLTMTLHDCAMHASLGGQATANRKTYQLHSNQRDCSSAAPRPEQH